MFFESKEERRCPSMHLCAGDSPTFLLWITVAVLLYTPRIRRNIPHPTKEKKPLRIISCPHENVDEPHSAMSALRSIGVFFCPDRARFGQNSVKEECCPAKRFHQNEGIVFGRQRNNPLKMRGLFPGSEYIPLSRWQEYRGLQALCAGCRVQRPARVKGSRPFGTR